MVILLLLVTLFLVGIDWVQTNKYLGNHPMATLTNFGFCIAFILIPLIVLIADDEIFSLCFLSAAFVIELNMVMYNTSNRGKA